MKIQKGIVKYKDRNDIVCTYGVSDDGKQFYFLDETDEKKFANGNRIASTELVEAIDPMVKASHIGIVSSNGKEVVPFVYKSIRPVNDSIVLVELSKPTSPSVLEAISLKSDPLSAAKLVSTPAAIKEKLNAKMGAEGRYLFNDQFSEFTVCDIDGNNLVENQLFSFAGFANGKLFLSKNTVDSTIVEFSVLPPEEQAKNSNDINVMDVSVPENVVDKAMDDASSSIVSDIPPIVTEDSSDESTSSTETTESVEEENSQVISVANGESIGVSDESSVEEAVAEQKIDDIQIVPDDGASVVEDNSVSENVLPVESVVVNDETIDNKDDAVNANDVQTEVVSEEKQNDLSSIEVETSTDDLTDESSSDEDLDDFVTSDIDEDDDEIAISFTEPTTSSLPSVEDSLSEENSVDVGIPDLNTLDDDVVLDISNDDDSDKVDVSTNLGLLDTDDFDEDLFDNDNYKSDKIENDDYYNDNFEKSYSSSKSNISSDSIMNDVAKSLTSLMKQNRSQKTIISEYKEKIDKLSASRRNIVEKAKIQEQKLEALNNKNRNFESTITKLEAKLQMLEGRIRDQDKLIAYQSKELESIKPQKDDLAKLVADAQALLGDDGSYTYDSSFYDSDN